MKTKVLIFCWFFAMFSLLLEASDAVVANYTGKVLVWQDNKWKNITKKGLILKEKDKIKTLNKSKVILLFKNGSTIIIGENSQVTIYELLNNISLILDEGEIRSQVIGLQQNQTFEVKTPISVASVRGTEFILSHIGNQTELIVVEGKVTLYDNSGNSYEVNQLEVVVVDNKGLVKKEMIEADKIKSFLDELKEFGGLKEILDEEIEKPKISEKQKLALREFIGEVRKEKFYLTEIVQQTKDVDFQTGRTLIDVHGNLTRVEQAISREKPNSIEFINLTKRNDYKYNGYFKDYASEVISKKPRIDILKLGIEFSQPLPQRLTQLHSYILKENRDSLNFYIKRVYLELSNKSFNSSDKLLQEVVFEKVKENNEEKLEVKFNMLISNGYQTYEIDTDYDEELKGELPQPLNKEILDGKLWTWSKIPLPLKQDINSDGTVNNQDIVWMVTENYLIQNSGEVLTPKFFISNNFKDPFSLIKEVAIESIVFIRKNDNTNFFKRNIDVVGTFDIILNLTKQVALSISGVLSGSEN